MFDCKPLEYVWAKFPGVYTRDNTIMMDDLRRNYVLNPQVAGREPVLGWLCNRLGPGVG